jgi:hypothetical protein
MPMKEAKNGHAVTLTLTRRSMLSRMQTTSCKLPARKNIAFPRSSQSEIESYASRSPDRLSSVRSYSNVDLAIRRPPKSHWYVIPRQPFPSMIRALSIFTFYYCSGPVCEYRQSRLFGRSR